MECQAGLGWGDWCPSGIPRRGVQPDLALPTLTFSTHSILGCVAWLPNLLPLPKTPEGQGRGSKVLEQLAAVLWPGGDALRRAKASANWFRVPQAQEGRDWL